MVIFPTTYRNFQQSSTINVQGGAELLDILQYQCYVSSTPLLAPAPSLTFDSITTTAQA
jgi:hypothetical protein